MKTMLALTATLVLAACATPDKPATVASTAQPVAGKYFCWRERLVTEGDKLICNWDTNASDACNSMTRTPLDRRSIATGPQNVKRCDNGQWLVEVTTR